MKYFKLKTIFSVILSIGLYACNLSPLLNSTNKYNGLLSFFYTNEIASISTLVLSGTLIDVNGIALDSATILISNNYSFSYNQKESVSKKTVTNSNGEFLLYLKEGKFTVKISKSNNDYLGSITVVINNPIDLPIIESHLSSYLQWYYVMET